MGREIVAIRPVKQWYCWSQNAFFFQMVPKFTMSVRYKIFVSGRCSYSDGYLLISTLGISVTARDLFWASYLPFQERCNCRHHMANDARGSSYTSGDECAVLGDIQIITCVSRLQMRMYYSPKCSYTATRNILRKRQFSDAQTEKP